MSRLISAQLQCLLETAVGMPVLVVRRCCWIYCASWRSSTEGQDQSWRGIASHRAHESVVASILFFCIVCTKLAFNLYYVIVREHYRIVSGW